MTAPIEVTPPSVYDAEWSDLVRRLPHREPMAALGLAPGDAVVVVVAHPDDETLGLGATLACLAAKGVDVHVVALTEGEAALDHLGRTPPRLGARRQAELKAACARLAAASSDVVGLPDGRLSAYGVEVETAVQAAVGRFSPQRLLTTWWRDPHPDHVAAGRAAVAVAGRSGIGVSGFPIWAQHWSDPATVDLKARTPHVMKTTARSRQARRLATDCYASQLAPLAPDLSPILPPSLVRWTAEVAFGG